MISQHNKEKPKISKPKESVPSPAPAVPAKKQVIPQQFVEEDDGEDWGDDFSTPTPGSLKKNLPLKPTLAPKKPSPLREQQPAPKQPAQPAQPPLKLAAPKKVVIDDDEDWGDDFPSVNGASGGLDSLKAKLGDLDIGDDSINISSNSSTSSTDKKKATLGKSISKKSNGNLQKYQDEDDDDDWDFAAKLAQKVHSKEKLNKLTGSILEKNREKRNIETSASDIFDAFEDELEVDDVFGEDDGFVLDQRDVFGKMNEVQDHFFFF